jgi:c-di-GMP-binding flagellar brake protein YcgR
MLKELNSKADNNFMQDRRKYPRVDVFSSISYICIDKNGNTIGQSMGVVLNVSQNGVLLEASCLVESEYVMLMAVDFNNKLIEIKGKIEYCRKDKSDKFKAGISLQGTYEENVRFVKKLLKANRYRKHNLGVTN